MLSRKYFYYHGWNSNTKEFLRLRDNNAVFAEARVKGYAGIPCFVLEDGTVTLNAEEAGLQPNRSDAPSCNIDSSGC